MPGQYGYGSSPYRRVRSPYDPYSRGVYDGQGMGPAISPPRQPIGGLQTRKFQPTDVVERLVENSDRYDKTPVEREDSFERESNEPNSAEWDELARVVSQLRESRGDKGPDLAKYEGMPLDIKEPEPNIFWKGVNALTEPLSGGYFGRRAREISGEVFPDSEKEELFKATGQGDWQDWLAWGEATFKGARRGAFEGVGDLADQMTAPADIAGLALGGGALGAASRGWKIANAMRRGAQAAGIPLIAHGGRGMYESGRDILTDPGENDWENVKKFGASALETAMGGAQMHFPQAALDYVSPTARAGRAAASKAAASPTYAGIGPKPLVRGRPLEPATPGAETDIFRDQGIGPESGFGGEAQIPRGQIPRGGGGLNRETIRPIRSYQERGIAEDFDQSQGVDLDLELRQQQESELPQARTRPETLPPPEPPPLAEPPPPPVEAPKSEIEKMMVGREPTKKLDIGIQESSLAPPPDIEARIEELYAKGNNLTPAENAELDKLIDSQKKPLGDRLKDMFRSGPEGESGSYDPNWLDKMRRRARLRREQANKPPAPEEEVRFPGMEAENLGDIPKGEINLNEAALEAGSEMAKPVDSPAKRSIRDMLGLSEKMDRREFFRRAATSPEKARADLFKMFGPEFHQQIDDVLKQGGWDYTRLEENPDAWIDAVERAWETVASKNPAMRAVKDVIDRGYTNAWAGKPMKINQDFGNQPGIIGRIAEEIKARAMPPKRPGLLEDEAGAAGPGERKPGAETFQQFIARVQKGMTWERFQQLPEEVKLRAAEMYRKSQSEATAAAPPKLIKPSGETVEAQAAAAGIGEVPALPVEKPAKAAKAPKAAKEKPLQETLKEIYPEREAPTTEPVIMGGESRIPPAGLDPEVAFGPQGDVTAIRKQKELLDRGSASDVKYKALLPKALHGKLAKGETHRSRLNQLLDAIAPITKEQEAKFGADYEARQIEKNRLSEIPESFEESIETPPGPASGLRAKDVLKPGELKEPPKKMKPRSKIWGGTKNWFRQFKDDDKGEIDIDVVLDLIGGRRKKPTPTVEYGFDWPGFHETGEAERMYHVMEGQEKGSTLSESTLRDREIPIPEGDVNMPPEFSKDIKQFDESIEETGGTSPRFEEAGDDAIDDFIDQAIPSETAPSSSMWEKIKNFMADEEGSARFPRFRDMSREDAQIIIDRTDLRRRLIEQWQGIYPDWKNMSRQERIASQKEWLTANSFLSEEGGINPKWQSQMELEYYRPADMGAIEEGVREIEPRTDYEEGFDQIPREETPGNWDDEQPLADVNQPLPPDHPMMKVYDWEVKSDAVRKKMAEDYGLKEMMAWPDEQYFAVREQTWRELHGEEPQPYPSGEEAFEAGIAKPEPPPPVGETPQIDLSQPVPGERGELQSFQMPEETRPFSMTDAGQHILGTRMTRNPELNAMIRRLQEIVNEPAMNNALWDELRDLGGQVMRHPDIWPGWREKYTMANGAYPGDNVTKWIHPEERLNKAAQYDEMMNQPDQFIDETGDVRPVSEAEPGSIPTLDEAGQLNRPDLSEQERLVRDNAVYNVLKEEYGVEALRTMPTEEYHKAFDDMYNKLFGQDFIDVPDNIKPLGPEQHGLIETLNEIDNPPPDDPLGRNREYSLNILERDSKVRLEMSRNYGRDQVNAMSDEQYWELYDEVHNEMYGESHKPTPKPTEAERNLFDERMGQKRDIIDRLKKFMSDEEGSAEVPEWAKRVAGLGEGAPPPRMQTEAGIGNAGGPRRPTGSQEELLFGDDQVPQGMPIERQKEDTYEPSIARRVWDTGQSFMSVDLPFMTSAAFRQASPLMWTDNWFKAWGKSMEAFSSKEAYDAIMKEIMGSKYFTKRYKPQFDSEGKIKGYKEIDSVAEEAGVRMSDVRNLLNREETLRKSLAEEVPIYGDYIMKSNRAYTAFLNSLRRSKFEQMMDARDWSGAGDNQAVAKQIAEFVNDATGRSSLRMKTPLGEVNAEKNANALAMALWSPRLVTSRMRFLNPMTYRGLDPAVRKEYLTGLFRTLGSWGAFAGLARMMGAEVNADPRSSDFGKIKIGDTRIDPGAGFQQLLVFAYRMGSGQFVSSRTGQKTEMGEGFKPRTRRTTAEEFAASKLHPSAKLAWDLLGASQSSPVHVGDRVVQMVLPMMAQDMWEVFQSDPELAPLLGAISSIGMGTANYGRSDEYGAPVFTDDIEKAFGLPHRGTWTAGTVGGKRPRSY